MELWFHVMISNQILKLYFNPLNTILEPFNDFYDKIILIIKHFLSNFTDSTESLGSTEPLSKDRTAQ